MKDTGLPGGSSLGLWVLCWLFLLSYYERTLYDSVMVTVNCPLDSFQNHLNELLGVPVEIILVTLIEVARPAHSGQDQLMSS